MRDSTCLNVRADECSVAGVVLGRIAVRFQGDEYLLLGFYFAHRPSGQRELFYILRLQTGLDGMKPPHEAGWATRVTAAPV